MPCRSSCASFAFIACHLTLSSNEAIKTTTCLTTFCHDASSSAVDSGHKTLADMLAIASLMLLLSSLPLLTVQELLFYSPTPSTQPFKGCAPKDLCHWDGRTNESLRNPSDMSHEVFNRTQCFCDPDCWKHRDCCIDADSKQANAHKYDSRWKCDVLPGSRNNDHIYVIGTCPSTWRDHNEAKLCERQISDDQNYSYLLDIPVFSKRTGKPYANMYCAKCNKDVQLSAMRIQLKCPVNLTNCTDMVRVATYMRRRHLWTVHVDGVHNGSTIDLIVQKFQHWQYLREKYYPRRCHPVTDHCPESNNNLSANCTAYASYIHTFHQQRAQTFKNYNCALCNNVSTMFVQCLASRTGAEVPTLSKPGPFPPSGGDVFTLSYSWLLDFHDPMGMTEVGLQFRCRNGEIFDPIYSVCMPFMCGKQFEKVNGECVRVEDSSATNRRNCRMLLVKKTDVTVLSPNTLYVNKTGIVYESGDFEEHDNFSYLICRPSTAYIEKFSAVQSRLSIASMTISLTCLAAHITIHLSISKLRNLPGKNLLNLSIALFLAQVLFIFGVNSATVYPALCIMVAIITHFCFLASFFWMNVMALDICRTFTSPNYRPHVGAQNKTFCRYAMYAWLFPAIIVATAITVDNTNILSSVRPSYGKHICWLSHRRGLLVFFALPLAILLLANTMFFVLTAYGIHQTTKVTRTVARKTSDRIRFYLYVKLAFIMGLTWALGFIAAVVEFEPLWYVFIVFNASQGAFIFIAFTLKRKVLRLVCECVTGTAPKVLAGGSSNNKPNSRRTSSIKTSSIIEYPVPSSENLVKNQL